MTVYQVKNDIQHVPYKRKITDNTYEQSTVAASIANELLSRLDWNTDLASNELTSTNMIIDLQYLAESEVD